jgi:uncharacterized protein DUF4326
VADRIQLRRQRGWRLPTGAIVVARPTPWGNPFTVADARAAGHDDPVRTCVELYRTWLCGDGPDTYHVGSRTYDRTWVHANLHLLAGRTLACWCRRPKPGEPDLCHAAVLLAVAAGGQP